MKKNNLEAMDLFLIVSLLGIGLFLILLLFSNGHVAAWLAMEGNFDFAFTDHFRHIAFASDMKHFYFNTQDATFPPFAYLLYYLLYKINPNSWGVNDWKECRDYQYNMLVYVILSIVVVVVFKYIIDDIISGYSNGKRLLFLLAIVLSAPMMAGALERGNISFLTAVMVLAALHLKESNNKYCREVALLLLAMAAGLKVYPAIAGVIYLREKRFNEAIRLVVYGLLFFFVPFVFCGGLSGMIQYFKILLFFEHQGYRSWTNVRNYLLSISDVLGVYDRSAYFVKYFILIENAYMLLCVLSIFKVKEQWKYALYVSGVMALYVPYSYRYTSVYMLIPLVLFMSNDNNNQKKIYTVLFALVFTIPAYGLITGWDANIFIFTPIYIIMIYSFIEDWIISSKRERFCMQKKI